MILEAVPSVCWDVHRDIGVGDGGRILGMSAGVEQKTV